MFRQSAPQLSMTNTPTPCHDAADHGARLPRRLRVPALGLAAALTAPVLLAQPGPQSADGAPPRSLVERLDQDGDGLVSRDEFFADDHVPAMRMLARADADGDGAVTRAELEATVDDIAEERRERAERHVVRRFEELDEDGDGMIMRADVLEQAFYRLDSNGDGFIGEDEAQAAQDKRRQRRGRRGERPGERPGETS